MAMQRSFNVGDAMKSLLDDMQRTYLIEADYAKNGVQEYMQGVNGVLSFGVANNKYNTQLFLTLSVNLVDVCQA